MHLLLLSIVPLLIAIANLSCLAPRLCHFSLYISSHI